MDYRTAICVDVNSRAAAVRIRAEEVTSDDDFDDVTEADDPDRTDDYPAVVLPTELLPSQARILAALTAIGCMPTLGGELIASLGD